jgi:hypothetical protein
MKGRMPKGQGGGSNGIKAIRTRADEKGCLAVLGRVDLIV